MANYPQQQSSPSRSYAIPADDYEFERKKEDDGCCSCCIAPCKLIGLLLFLPCCIVQCCKARNNFNKEAKEFKDKCGDTITSQPKFKLARPPSVTASEMVSKLHIPAPKYKVEPAPDKVKVIEEGEASGMSGIDNNKEFLELESLPSSKM